MCSGLFLGKQLNYGSVMNQRGKGKAEFAPQLEVDVGIKAKRKQATGDCRLSSKRNLIFLLLREGGGCVAGWVVTAVCEYALQYFAVAKSNYGCPTLTQPHWYVLGWIIKWQCYYWFLEKAACIYYASITVFGYVFRKLWKWLVFLISSESCVHEECVQDCFSCSWKVKLQYV